MKNGFILRSNAKLARRKWIKQSICYFTHFKIEINQLRGLVSFRKKIFIKIYAELPIRPRSPVPVSLVDWVLQEAEWGVILAGDKDVQGYVDGIISAALYPARSRKGGIVKTISGPALPMTTE